AGGARRARRGPRRGPGQRAVEDPADRVPFDPALHQVRRLPERLPRLPADRRARVRRRLRRPDRRGPHATPRGVRARRRPAERLVALRRLHRGLPRRDPAARAPARPPPGGCEGARAARRASRLPNVVDRMAIARPVPLPCAAFAPRPAPVRPWRSDPTGSVPALAVDARPRHAGGGDADLPRTVGRAPSGGRWLMDRTAFLARVRGALAGVEVPALPATFPRTPASGDPEPGDLADRFLESLSAIGG